MTLGSYSTSLCSVDSSCGLVVMLKRAKGPAESSADTPERNEVVNWLNELSVFLCTSVCVYVCLCVFVCVCHMYAYTSPSPAYTGCR